MEEYDERDGDQPNDNDHASRDRDRAVRGKKLAPFERGHAGLVVAPANDREENAAGDQEHRHDADPRYAEDEAAGQKLRGR